jgi:hypothetical protein
MVVDFLAECVRQPRESPKVAHCREVGLRGSPASSDVAEESLNRLTPAAGDTTNGSRLHSHR